MRPQPSPAAFDGHWLTPGQMARMLPYGAMHLARLDMAGKLPAGAVSRTVAGQRRYDAGKILAWQQHRQDTR